MIPLTVPGFNAGQAFAVGGFDAGLPIRELHREARAIFPILGVDVEVLPDTPASSWGLAWYRGLNAQGLGRFAVRDDVALNRKIAHHEAGHELEDLLRRASGAPEPWDLFSIGRVDVLGRYWSWRDFPGRWQDAHLDAVERGEWGRFPSESFAETVSAAVIGADPYIFQWGEWTLTYGLPLMVRAGNIYDPIGGAMRARAFVRELIQEIAPEVEDDDMTPDQERKLDRVLALLEAEGPKVWNAREQRGLDVETGKPFDPTTTPVDPRIRQ